MRRQFLDLGGGDRTLGTRIPDASFQLVAVKLLAIAVAFDQDWRGRQPALVSGKALVAHQAFAASPDTILNVGSIQHFQLVAAAVRALHGGSQSPIGSASDPVEKDAPEVQRALLVPYMGGMVHTRPICGGILMNTLTRF